MVDGLWCEDATRIKGEIKRHFSSVFSDYKGVRPKLRSGKIAKLDEGDARSLERPFEEGEVWNAVCGCGLDKAPAPTVSTSNLLSASGV